MSITQKTESKTDFAFRYTKYLVALFVLFMVVLKAYYRYYSVYPENPVSDSVITLIQSNPEKDQFLGIITVTNREIIKGKKNKAVYSISVDKRYLEGNKVVDSLVRNTDLGRHWLEPNHKYLIFALKDSNTGEYVLENWETYTPEKAENILSNMKAEKH